MAHRSVQREVRRRRVLREEARPGTAPRKRRVAGGDRLFSDAALERNQPRITDLLPQRKLSLFKMFAVGFGTVASVESLYALREQYLRKYAQIDTSWLDLEGNHTLASCVAALLLIAAALAASLVFHIRRYRMDDYRGRYRIWYPVILLLGWAAADVMTSAHASLCGIAMTLSPGLSAGTGAALWILVWLVLGGSLLLRAAIDARQCRPTVCAWLLSAGLLSFAAALELNLLQLPAGHFSVMARTGSLLWGLHLLAFGLLLYARHLFQHAQGVQRPTASRKQTDERADELQEEAQSATPKDAAKREAAKRTGVVRLPSFRLWRSARDRTAPRGADGADADLSDGELSRDELALLENPDLTRTERRKLKKQMKLRRRQAA